MPLVPSRQYMCAYGQNTYHRTERLETPWCVLTNPTINAVSYVNANSRENVGHSFENIYDDLNVDPRKEWLNRFIQPEYRCKDIEKRKALLSSCSSPRKPQDCNNTLFSDILY